MRKKSAAPAVTVVVVVIVESLHALVVAGSTWIWV